MPDYYVIPTNIGEAKMANALALGIPLAITELALGDGEGDGARGTPLPNPEATALVSERRRAPLNSFSVDPDNDNVLVAEQVIPETAGGWWIREMGLFDEDGDLIFVCNTPPTYKPQLSEGSGRTQVVRMASIVSDTAAVTLKVDPSVVLATRDYADGLVVGLREELTPEINNRVIGLGSVSDLEAIDGNYDGQQSLAGGVTFKWSEGDSTEPDGIYVIAPSASGRWLRLQPVDGIESAKDYYESVKSNIRPDQLYAYKVGTDLVVTVMQTIDGTTTPERYLCEYRMKEDPDGLYLLDSIKTGEANPEGAAVSSAVVPGEIVGDWDTTSTTLWYATAPDATFSHTLPEGTKCRMHTRTDDRGGIWEVTVYASDGKELAKRRFSCFSASLEDGVEILIAEDLPLDEHTVVGVFLGDDPLNAPSGGAGTSRGWLRVGDSDSFFTVDQTPSYTLSANSKFVMNNSIQEFAIQARPEGTDIDFEWVPTHAGDINATLDISRFIYTSGDTYGELYGSSSIGLIRDYPQSMNSLKMIQKYKARNANDPNNTDMWYGFLMHEWKPGEGMTVRHTIQFIDNCEINSAYLFQMAGVTSEVPFIKTSGPQISNYEAVGDAPTKLIPINKSVLRYGGRLDGDIRNLFYASTSESCANTYNYSERYAVPPWRASRITDRVDNISKLYHQSAEPGSLMPLGTEWTSVSKTIAGIARTSLTDELSITNIS